MTLLARIARRTGQMVLVVVGVVTLIFFVLRLAAGDPARLMLPPGAPEKLVEQVRAELGTDKPIVWQYVDYLGRLVGGDLGTSFHGNQPVRDAVLGALPNTVALGLATMVVASLLALLLGIAAALRSGGLVDRAVLVYAAAGQSMPPFWLGVVLVLVFSLKLGWLPAVGLGGVSSFVLPVATLVAVLTPILIRTVRQSFLDVLTEDHVRAARMRGIVERRVLLIHVLKSASLPLVTLIGLQTGFVLAGAYVVEFIFNWPGIGKLTIDAVASRNFPMIQGGVLVAAVGFVLVNFVVDLIYTVLDPRIRYAQT